MLTRRGFFALAGAIAAAPKATKLVARPMILALPHTTPWIALNPKFYPGMKLRFYGSQQTATVTRGRNGWELSP